MRDAIQLKPLADLNAEEVAEVVKDGVYRGVAKAIGTYLLLSGIVAFVLYAIGRASP